MLSGGIRRRACSICRTHKQAASPTLRLKVRCGAKSLSFAWLFSRPKLKRKS